MMDAELLAYLTTLTGIFNILVNCRPEEPSQYTQGGLAEVSCHGML